MINFNNCLKNRRIFLSDDAKDLVEKELAEAIADLEEAQDRFAHGKYKYSTTTS